MHFLRNTSSYKEVLHDIKYRFLYRLQPLLSGRYLWKYNGKHIPFNDGHMANNFFGFVAAAEMQHKVKNERQ
jgi:hypothetical protein